MVCICIKIINQTFLQSKKESNFRLDGYYGDNPELNILLEMDVDEYPTMDTALELDPATR